MKLHQFVIPAASAGLAAAILTSSAMAQTGAPEERRSPITCDNRLRAESFDLMQQGDVSGARAMIAQDVEAREACAAFILAETYDPLILSSFGDRAPPAEPDKALNAYQIAASAGVADAGPRMARLECYIGRKPCESSD